MKKKRIENLIVTLIAVFISLPTYADDNANTSNVYKLVTNVSELTTDGTLFIIANKEKGTALCKNFYTLNKSHDNLVEMQPYGDFFIINEKIATFKLEIVGKYDDKKYLFQLEPYKDSYGNSGYLSCLANYQLSLQSKSNSYIDVKEIDNKGKAYLRRQSPAANLGFYNKNTIHFINDYTKYVYIYKSITPSLTLETSKSLSETVKDKDITGKVPSIKIDRSFIADGGWYTICLPFSLTEDDIKKQFKCAEFQGFDGVDQQDKTINLKFKKVTTTKAGKPYLIKPIKDITAADLTFINKQIEQTTPVDVSYMLESDANKTFTFKGVFSPFTADSEELADKNIKFLSGVKGLDLVSPNGTGTMKCYRAYFVFPGKKSIVETEAKITNHDEATAVQPVKRQEAETEHVVFSISGQKMGKVKNASQLPKGVYIINKKRIMVK
ncbi:MAG: hypothetical protein MR592_01215 [Prevotella sp.]|nr:hypothetical protein [Prevotella sp.]